MTIPPRAVIAGIGGQDGYYLSKTLIAQGYSVFGLRHRLTSQECYAKAQFPSIQICKVDDYAPSALRDIIEDIRPHEIYNLAGISASADSWHDPTTTARINALIPLHFLEAIRHSSLSRGAKPVRFFNASSAEIFGSAETPRNEDSALNPQTPYGAAKAFGHEMVRIYREAYGLFSVNGILYSHESPLRPETFVSRKITRAVARIALGLQESVSLGKLEVRRDWGHAQDFCDAMWRMLQHSEPRDYVISTGQTHSIRQLLATAFSAVGIDDWEAFVSQDPAMFRPKDPPCLAGDNQRIRSELGWVPQISFSQLIHEMIQEDLKILGHQNATHDSV